MLSLIQAQKEYFTLTDLTFNKIANNLWDDLTDREISVLAGSRPYKWLNQFYDYLKRNKINISWPKSNAKKVNKWANDKNLYECRMYPWDRRCYELMRKFESIKSNVSNTKKMVSFTFDVSIIGYDNNTPYDQIKKEYTNQHGLFVHYYTDDYIVNNRKKWRNKLIKAIKSRSRYNGDYVVDNIETYNIKIYNFIPIKNNIYSTMDDYEFVYTNDTSLDQIVKEHNKKMEILEKTKPSVSKSPFNF